jgi:hypothetical protein
MARENESSTAPLRPAEPDVGFDVFTDDGMPVGAVSEISDGFMRIDAHLRPDFWLRLDDATNVEGRAITLAYPREALPQHKHSGPAPSAIDFMPTGADPVLLDEEEQRKQRELMERELDEQRWRREQLASAEADWQHEQGSGAKITGIVTAAVAAMAGLAMVMFVRRMMRRHRRRRIADLLPTS